MLLDFFPPINGCSLLVKITFIYLLRETVTVSNTTKILSVWKKTVFLKIRHGYHPTMTSELFQRKENFYSHNKRNVQLTVWS